MKRKKPSFNETYYGFRSFSSLLEDAQRRGVVTLRRDQKSGSYIVEDLGAAARGDGSIVALVRPKWTRWWRAFRRSQPRPSRRSRPERTFERRLDQRARRQRSRRVAEIASRVPNVGPHRLRPSHRSRPPLLWAHRPSQPATGDDIAVSSEVETPDGEAPTRPRRGGRGGRGRGRGEKARRGSRVRTSKRVAKSPCSVHEDSNPSIPTPPRPRPLMPGRRAHGEDRRSRLLASPPPRAQYAGRCSADRASRAGDFSGTGRVTQLSSPQ